MIRAYAALLPCLLLAFVACDSGPDDSTGTTGPGGGGSGAGTGGSGGGEAGTAGGGGAGTAGGSGAAGSSSGSTSPTLGFTCKDDATCTEGLTCLPLSNGSGADCKEVARACSKPCTSDAECGAEGEALCVDDCGLGGKRCAKDGFSGKIGETCSAKKTCAAGLSCLPFQLSKPGGACETVDEVCSKACENDASCSDLGPNVKCFGCGDAKLCGLSG